MNMSLKDWLRNKWLVEHQTSPEEIRHLLEVTDRDLADCKTPGLSTDWRFGIAYNAALQVATAVLAASGYRAAREAHHYRVIQSLAYTIKADQNLVRKFDRFRKKRNIGGYERVGVVSDAEAGEMFDLAKSLREDVVQWLQENHPGLLNG
jgi:hypothetical protein